MDDLTPHQVAVLKALGKLAGAWLATDLCRDLGIRASSCGVALKGLYGRRLVTRLRPEPHTGARYEITAAGTAVLAMLKDPA